jgi:hypothetical protein
MALGSPINHVRCFPIVWVILLGSLLLLPISFSFGLSLNERFELVGYTQLGITLVEKAEGFGTILQASSRDEAADVTAGFQLYRTRIGILLLPGDSVPLGFQLSAELVGSFHLMDIILEIPIRKWFVLKVGQQKIPSLPENLQSATRLHFIDRSLIAQYSADYALSRTTYPSSLFYGNRSRLRDLGLSISGTTGVEDVFQLDYFIMIGNGLGANLYIGNVLHKEFILTNPFQFFYGTRIDMGFLPDKLIHIGGHISYNRHDNILFNSQRVVNDLNRLSYSGDACFIIPKTGLSIGGVYAGGFIADDFYNNGSRDAMYEGWEIYLLWNMIPLVTRFLKTEKIIDHHLGWAFRGEDYMEEADESGIEIHRYRITLGFNYGYRNWLFLRLNYLIRILDDPYNPDLDDDALLLQVQFQF